MTQKILVVDHDMNNLSRIYLSLLHRQYKVEVTNKTEEILQRIKRFKPALLVMDEETYNEFKTKLRLTTIVMVERNSETTLNYGDLKLIKPFSMHELLKLVEEWII